MVLLKRLVAGYAELGFRPALVIFKNIDGTSIETVSLEIIKEDHIIPLQHYNPERIPVLKILQGVDK